MARYRIGRPPRTGNYTVDLWRATVADAINFPPNAYAQLSRTSGTDVQEGLPESLSTITQWDEELAYNSETSSSAGWIKTRSYGTYALHASFGLGGTGAPYTSGFDTGFGISSTTLATDYLFHFTKNGASIGPGSYRALSATGAADSINLYSIITADDGNGGITSTTFSLIVNNVA